MAASPEVEESIIVCVTYPSYSSKYFATVCMAAITERGDLRRIYPVTWREYQEKGPIVGDRIRYRIRDEDTDRPESCKIVKGSIEIVGRRSASSIFSEIESRSHSLCDLQEQEIRSLGFVKPTIQNLSVDSSKDRKKDAKKFNNQTTLSGESLPVLAIPHHIRFQFDCCESCCSQHNIMCEDMRFCNKYWEFEETSASRAEIEVQYQNWVDQYSDLYFMVGTHHRWGSWLIISLLSEELL